VILDCESLGESLVIFDLLSEGGTDLRVKDCETRLGLLDFLAPPPHGSCLAYIQTARTEAEKRDALVLLLDGGAEGVVFKRRDASYSAGRPSSGGPGLKWKFTVSATVRVSKINAKRSVNMAMADGTAVGSVTIPPNHKVPAVGDLIEVVYLYAHRGGSLAQPVYKSVREDADGADTTDSLQFKGEER
jgi:bifunctional non-homologous end joining protein LigD